MINKQMRNAPNKDIYYKDLTTQKKVIIVKLEPNKDFVIVKDKNLNFEYRTNYSNLK
jgi:hypothetical protein